MPRSETDDLPHLSPKDHAIAGGISGAISRCVAQPFDVLKIRLQLQVEPIRKGKGIKYTSTPQAVKKIFQDEGLRAFWKGHMCAQILSICYGITQFTTFEFISKIVSEETRRKPQAHFLCGAISGGCAMCVSFPIDVIKTRLVSQGEPKAYRGITEAFVKIFKQEGVRAYYKGLLPTMIEASPHTGAQFAFFAFYKDIWRQIFEKEENKEKRHSSSVVVPVSFTGSLICGTLAGMCAKSLVYPLDLLRKRLQVQGFQHQRKGFGKAIECSGLIDCLLITIREENIWGLYKGLAASLIKAGVMTGTCFCCYEQVCRLLEKRK